MRVISEKALRQFSEKYIDSKPSLASWQKVVSKADWRHIVDVKKVYPSADTVGRFTVFNINGNNYRLIVSINYKKQIIFIKDILTHVEYDLGAWKNDPYF
jgi:mRNA interferase HigB